MAIDKECPTCDGTGEAIVSCCTGEVLDSDCDLCPDCHEHCGSEECPDCGGTGKVDEEKKEFSPVINSIARAEYIADLKADR